MPVPPPVERVLFSDDTVQTPTLGMNGRKKGPLNGSIPMNFGELVYALTVCRHPITSRWLEELVPQVSSTTGLKEGPRNRARVVGQGAKGRGTTEVTNWSSLGGG